MNQRQAWDLLVETTLGLVADDGSDVVNAEEFEGRWAVRMAQQTRDFTTVWFTVGERTVGFEAYLLPNPSSGHHEVYRQLLARNFAMWRAHFAIDRKGDLFLVGRVPLSDLTSGVIDEVFGAVYEAVELSFRSLLRAVRAGQEPE